MPRQNPFFSSTARKRALRAARAVTIGLGLSAAACSTAPLAGSDAAVDARVAASDLSGSTAQDLTTARDLAVPPDFAVPPDLAIPPDLARVADLTVVPDLTRMGDLAGFDDVCPPNGNPGTDPDCCTQSGGFWWDGACAVPGPFVPPAGPASDLEGASVA